MAKILSKEQKFEFLEQKKKREINNQKTILY